MLTLRIILGGLVAGLLLTAGPAGAQQQQIDVTARKPLAPEVPPPVVAPNLRYQTSHPPDGEFYPGGPRVGHDPGFLEAASTETGSGRMGLSAWTAPNTPVGAASTGHREVTGWFAIGFSITWDGPPPARRPAR